MLIPPIGSFLWSLNDEKSLNNTHTTKQQKRTNNGFRNTKNHPAYLSYLLTYLTTHPGGGGGEGYFRNFWVGMCRWDPGTSSLYQSSFKWILLPYTRLKSQNTPYPSEAVFQKLQRSQTQSSQNKTDLIFSYFWVAIPGFPSLN